MSRALPPISAWTPRALAREQADAARDRGDHVLERLFERLARELEPLVEPDADR